ncbi:hypothetical protein [Haladaptatus salinisoli]|uniref:hypothetical protein n=1 Tax=Haladaptatus salinisoli TaxID=2884876 RepID=UPI001D0B89B3|nr:hypothetical protein [Haladaptatus salinisoli]
MVEVTNESYDNPADHHYVVTLGNVMACTCPHHVHRHAFCSHEIGHMAALIDAPPLDPLSPGEWLTKFLANSDD